MIDTSRSPVGGRQRLAAASLVVIALVAGCGDVGVGSGRPVSKPEDIISGKGTLVDQKTGGVGEGSVPSDYGPPTKKR